MTNSELCIGDVIQSKAGRDKGKYFMVYSIVDEEFITVVNGSMRKQSKPKKKRRKHIKAVGTHIPMIAQKLGDGVHVFDVEIRKALEEAGFKSQIRASKKEG